MYTLDLPRVEPADLLNSRLDPFSVLSEVVEDHSDLDEILREAIFQDNTAQLNMRLPPAMKAVLSKLARQRTTDATTLARIWLGRAGAKTQSGMNSRAIGLWMFVKVKT